MFVGQLAAFTSMMLAASQAERQPRSGSYDADEALPSRSSGLSPISFGASRLTIFWSGIRPRRVAPFRPIV